ncbi:helix-turn-helix domain-containing protein [Paraburkholderia silviterrae]|uniref:Helix-turn-helix domain-containing protein n=1 Tax=Paraburkholderia silviterrae TaxID=2528715 RepID=A0A4R5MAT3_9BURK|nr:helix-turn-helix domain-containing protein [Paraburkholderia silviterrae]TDG23244.1 helix-turn-helix domain-containing protein [Paraburkholderia silviterrae]
MKPWTWRQAIINSTLPPTTRFVLLTLSCHINDAGEPAYPSTALLADETGLSERAVVTHLRDAAALGWLTVTKHGYGGQKWARNQYYPRVPEGFEIRERVPKGTESGSVPSKKGRGKKALKDVQCPVDKGTEGGSVPSEKALNVVPEGTEPDDRKALNEVQSNTAVNPALNAAAEVRDGTAAAAAQKIGNPENPEGDVAPPDAEAKLLAVLQADPKLEIDPLADRVHVLTWVGKGVTPEQLAVACQRALAARDRTSDTRRIYPKFLDRFVGEVLAEGKTASVAEASSASTSAPWYMSDSGIGAQGKRVCVERRPNETTPDYLVRVAQASGRGPWIEYVLKREQGGGRYRQIVEFFDDLLPADFGV